MHFEGSHLHPSCALIVWLAAVIAVQSVDFFGIFLLAVAALVWAPAGIRPWFAYIGRARWLLAVLWLIMAYQTPGEAINDVAWAPTYEGLTEANRHVLRLVAVLAWLAWLFARCGRDGIVIGLWGLLRPWVRYGIDSERLVVRLALVLDNLEKPMEKGAWRHILADDGRSFPGPVQMVLAPRQWAWRDSATLTISLFVLGWVLFR